MQDRPTKIELLRGVEYFLKDEAIPALEGPAQFNARVAARAIKIVIAELESEEDDLNEEYDSLCELLDCDYERPLRLDELRESIRDLNAQLVDRIRQGEADDPGFRKRLFAHLKPVHLRKLAVNNPKMGEIIAREYGLDGGPQPVPSPDGAD